jgi:hypothetical protein
VLKENCDCGGPVGVSLIIGFMIGFTVSMYFTTYLVRNTAVKLGNGYYNSETGDFHFRDHSQHYATP